MDAETVSPEKPTTPGQKSSVGLRVVALLYAGLSIYLMTQTGHPPGVPKYPSALSWIAATNSFALIGSILGFLVTLPACRQKTLGSLTVLCYTVSFFLGIASLLVVLLTYFSIYWIVFTGMHIFCSLLAVGAAYAQFRFIARQESLEETMPLASALPPQVTEAAV